MTDILSRHIGFTGTQKGMTTLQKMTLKSLLSGQEFTAHHGGCVGADTEFHAIVKAQGCRVVLHPSNIEVKQGDCQLQFSDDCWRAWPPLARNKRIVDSVGLLLACPKEKTMQVRSGTWSTVRYAQEKKLQCILVFPDGTCATTEPR